MTNIHADIRHIVQTELTEPFVSGNDLAEALIRTGNPLYAGRSVLAVACLVRDAVSVKSTQRRVHGKALRGYIRDDLLQVL